MARTRLVWLSCLLAVLAAFVPGILAADRSPPSEPIDLFDALKHGQIEAQFIAKDSRECRLLMTNKTDRPLSVCLPAVFAATPVLAQFNNNFNAFNQPQNANQTAPQPVGVAPNGPGNVRPGPFNVQNQRPFGPGALFNIPPEKLIKVKLPAVCLEHGRTTPRPSMKYEIKPLEDVTTTAGVSDVLAMLGRGEVAQETAQLAAWNLANGISWQQLANEKEVFTQTARYSPSQLKAAKKLADRAVELARARQKASTNESTAAR